MKLSALARVVSPQASQGATHTRKGKVEIGCPVVRALIPPQGIGHARVCCFYSSIIGLYPTLYQSSVDGTTDDADGGNGPDASWPPRPSAQADLRARKNPRQQGNVPAGEDVPPPLQQPNALFQQWQHTNESLSESGNESPNLRKPPNSQFHHVPHPWKPRNDQTKWTRR